MKKIIFLILIAISAFTADAQYPLIYPYKLVWTGSPTTGTWTYYSSASGGSIRFAFSGTDRARFAADGGVSFSDNGVFDQQLLLNLSHDGTSQDNGINATCYSSAGYGNTFTGRLAGGSGASPAATPINGKLSEFTGKGHTGVAFSISNRWLIGGYTARTFSVGNEPTRAIVKTTPVGSTTLTNSAVFEENGSVGITPNDTLNETYPAAFDATNARWLEITATGTGSDEGIFVQNRSMVEGFHLWHDNSANITYFDDILDNSGAVAKIRMRTLGTPVDAITITPTGVDYLGEQGYSLQFSAASFNPVDATTYHIGGNYQDAGTAAAAADLVRIYIPKAGTIKYANFFIHVNTALGSSETSTVSIRINNTTDVTISAGVKCDAATQNFSNTALATAVVQNDYIEIKWVCPTWVTNPTAVRISGSIYIE